MRRYVEDTQRDPPSEVPEIEQHYYHTPTDTEEDESIKEKIYEKLGRDVEPPRMEVPNYTINEVMGDVGLTKGNASVEIGPEHHGKIDQTSRYQNIEAMEPQLQVPVKN